MLYAIFSLIIFFSGLSVFGWVFYSLIFKEKRLFVLIPVSVILGISSYLILLNAISYFIPIIISFYLVWLILVLPSFVSIFLFHQKLKSIELGISKKYFTYLIIVSLIIGIFSAIGNRDWGGGELGVSRMSLPGLIAGGNFPVKDVLAPQKPTTYHYASGLLTASTNQISSLSIWSGYIIQAGIFSWLIILLSFLLCYEITKNEFVSLLASLVFFFGNGLRYLLIFFKTPLVFYQFLTNNIPDSPFAFIGAALKSDINHPVVSMIYNRWAGLAFSLILLIIFLYFLAIKRKNWLVISLICGVLLGFLALSAETYFMVLSGAIFLYPFLIFCLHKIKKYKEYLTEELLKNFLISVVILLIGGLVAIFQGGLITAFIREGLFLKILSINISTITSINPDLTFNNLAKAIMIEVGLVLLLFIPALFYFRKKKEIFFIALIITISTVPLFLFSFKESLINSNMDKFFFLPITLIHLVAGMFLGFLIIKTSKIKKIIFYSLFYLIIGGGIVFQFFEISYPAPWKSREFFAGPPSSNLIDYNIKNWISKNTDINNHFMAIQDVNFFPEYNFEDSRLGFSFIESLFFPAYYNRFTPAPISIASLFYEIPPLRAKNIQEMKEQCSGEALKNLNITYIYATPQWPLGLEEKCLTNNELSLVFKSGENKIYKVINVN